MKKISCLRCIALLLFAAPIQVAYAQSGYKVIKKVNVPGDGKWDFITFDNESRKVYLSHGTVMQVVDIDKGALVGEVKNTPGIHGIAIARQAGKGFTSNGKDSSVTVFDLTTLATLKTIKIPGSNPDHIIYDSFSKNIFVFNNKSGDVSIIDPTQLNVLKTVKLGGMPELAVADGNGNIYLNLEDKSELIKFDVKTYEVKARWPLAPGEEPTGIAFDLKNNRLFAGCVKLLVVVNAETGKVITTLPIGDKVDGVAFDPATKLIVTSNGEGSATIIQQESADSYKVLENVPTAPGAKTIALDEAKHLAYIPVADLTTEPNSKSKIKPNTFGVLVIGK